MAVEEFKEGYYYRIWPLMKERPEGFNENGLMDAMLDGKWRKCIVVGRYPYLASFKGGVGGVWSWDDVMHTMQECPVDPKVILKGLIEND